MAGGCARQACRETRKVLLGHTNGSITTQYSAVELEELIEATCIVDQPGGALQA